MSNLLLTIAVLQEIWTLAINFVIHNKTPKTEFCLLLGFCFSLKKILYISTLTYTMNNLKSVRWLLQSVIMQLCTILYLNSLCLFVAILPKVSISKTSAIRHTNIIALKYSMSKRAIMVFCINEFIPSTTKAYRIPDINIANKPIISIDMILNFNKL